MKNARKKNNLLLHHRASLDDLFRLMNQYMDKSEKHRGRRTHEDVEMWRVAERG